MAYVIWPGLCVLAWPTCPGLVWLACPGLRGLAWPGLRVLALQWPACGPFWSGRRAYLFTRVFAYLRVVLFFMAVAMHQLTN